MGGFFYLNQIKIEKIKTLLLVFLFVGCSFSYLEQSNVTQKCDRHQWH